MYYPSSLLAYARNAAVIGLCVVLSPLGFAQTAPAPATPLPDDPAADSSVVKMNPFDVSTSKDYGYRKMSSVTSSKTGELISQMPQSIEVISSELLKDFVANQGNDAFRYSSSVTVSENEVGQADVFNLRGFALPRYYNGVALANASSLVPINIWDNIDRIEVVKGPVGLYYANSTPNGVANYITKKPQFINSSSIDFTYGSYQFGKVVVDDQQLVGKYAAIRVIASGAEHGAGYRTGSPTRYTFVSPSVTIRPFKTLEVTAELDYLNEHDGYQGGANAWAYSFNPDWQKDLTTPTPQILSYFQTTYNLATPAAAQAFIQTRWSPPNSAAGPALATWSADMQKITGTAPFLYTTQHVNWSLYSPLGDRLAPQSNQSTYGGNSPTYEVSVTETPFPELSLRYHWVHAATNQEFVRQIIQPNTNGFRANGEVNSLDASNLALQGTNNFGRDAYNDTQQVDLHFEKTVWDIKNEFGVGAEMLRTASVITVAPLDFTKAGTVTTPGGTVLTGIQIYQNYDPFGGGSVPSLYALQSGPPVINGHANLAKDHQYYASYRVSFFDDRVHALFGVNQYTVDPSGPLNSPIGHKNTTYTYGAIGEVVKGLSVFASHSSAVQFTNQQSASGIGVLPSDNAHVLNSELDKGYEVGVKTTWHNDELTCTSSYYDDERNGVVAGDQLRTLTDPRNANVTTVQFFTNGGLYRSRGIDTDLTWTPNQSFQLVLNYNHSLEAQIVSDPSVNPNTPGSLAYQREFLLPLSHAPRDRFNLVGKYNFRGGFLDKVSVGGAIRYSSTYEITNSASYNLWVPTETMLDAFISYRMKLGNIPADLKLNVTNLTNVKDDYTWGDGITEYATLTLHF